MGKFMKAKGEQAYLKLALYGKPGSGKTLTSLLWAEGLAGREGKRTGKVNTERGSEFYGLSISERTVHPKAFDFDRLITRSLMETIEAVEMRVTGTKLKAEGETPHEPHILGRMCPERDEKGGYIIKAFFEKDRSGILTGKDFLWPTYETIAPVVGYLCGGEQGKLRTPEEAAERTTTAQEAAQEKAARERKELFDQIRAALMGAKTIAQLQTAWSLTNGKKTRLGEEFHTQLLVIKDSRKAELLEVA